MILTISGPPGSGKDTVAKLLSENLGYELLSLGNLRRKAAENKGITIEEFNSWSSLNPQEGDKYFDDFQKEYGRKNNNFIMVSRLGWYFIPHSVKIYIDVDETIGAKRILIQKQSLNSRNEQTANTIEEQEKLNKNRVNSDIDRYNYLYKINPYKKDNYNIVIDSTTLTPKEVADKIIETINKK